MPRSADGGLHGLLAWALLLLATVYLVSTAASSLMSGVAGVLGTAATATATVGTAAALKQAKQKAREAADATAKGVARGMLLGSLALAFGALTAFWGGSMGQRRESAAVVLPA